MLLLLLHHLLIRSVLEKKVKDMDEQRQVELKIIQEEKEQLQSLVLRQTAVIGQLEQQLIKVSSNNTALQRQQQELLDTVNNLIHSISLGSFPGKKLWVIVTYASLILTFLLEMTFHH